MKIWTRAVLLLAIPIVFDGLGIGLLAHSVQSLEGALILERKQSENLRLIDRLFMDFVQATGQYWAFVTGGGDHERLDSTMSFINDGKRDIAKLRSHNSNDPKFLLMLTKLEVEGFDALKKLTVENGSSESVILSISRLRPLMLRVSKANDICMQMFSDKNEEREALLAVQKREVDTLFSLITLAAIMNLSSAALAVFLFRQSISNRLHLLIENSRRISKLENPGPSIGGNDEFSELDSVLRKVHQEVKENDEFRSNVVTMVAHDLRSPLASIKIALEMAQSGHFGKMDTGVKERVDSAFAISSDLIYLTDGFLDLNKIQEGKLNLDYSTFYVVSLIEDSIASLIHLAAARKITIKITGKDGEMRADKRKLYQVLVNLVTNAIKFSPAGSQIDISSEFTDSRVIISVKDEGPGISKDAKEMLFKRFSQGETKSEVLKGSGLGLFLSRWFVEAHGGEIGIDSEPGSGSRFWLVVPVKRNEAANTET
ncbi:MAG: HAMP domain-containing histidine kinase [Leptolyngbya sp.]|nr:HAMP domain-containing histidine kinase [Candidatus Melainabacteria bacterium]